MRQYQVVIDVLGQERAFMLLYTGKSGDLVRCYQSLVNRLTDFER